MLDDRFELAFLENYQGREYEAVIAFFWMAPSTQEYLSHKIQGPCYGLPDLICDEETWGRKAYDLIAPIIHRGPCYGRLAWRSYLAEPLYDEAYTVHLLLQTAEFIAQLKEKWSVSQVFIEDTLPANIFPSLRPYFIRVSRTPLPAVGPFFGRRGESPPSPEIPGAVARSPADGWLEKTVGRPAGVAGPHLPPANFLADGKTGGIHKAGRHNFFLLLSEQ